ncbi:hypothetical protein [Arthrobacter ulcerisalmonis]|nr:hypothetical protein [Arthrobacter ulcerisalmonis]
MVAGLIVVAKDAGASVSKALTRGEGTTAVLAVSTTQTDGWATPALEGEARALAESVEAKSTDEEPTMTGRPVAANPTRRRCAGIMKSDLPQSPGRD